MLGSNCNVVPSNNTKSCIEIRDWDVSPQNKGCIKYKGKYYVNLVTGNTSKPDEGLLSGTYAVGSSDYCDIIRYHSINQQTCNESSAFIKFFTGIEEYSNCNESTVFDCGEFVIFKTKDGTYELNQSLISNNDRHPHDRTAWKNHGVFTNILKNILNGDTGHSLTIPYWTPCNSGANCQPLYNKRNCTVEKIVNGSVDECGNPLYDELIFVSIGDKNIDQPSVGAAKDVPTWEGPYTECEFFSRPVTVNKNGDLHYPGDESTRLCSIGCDEIDGKGIVWKKNTLGEYELSLGQLGIDRFGNPVMAGSCLVTCSSEIKVVSIDDSKPGVTTITLSDGTVINGPEVDNDVKVSSFTQNNGLLTITLSDGTIFTATLPPPLADNYVTGLSISPTGLVTAYRNNGLPPLTSQIIFPVIPPDSYVTSISVSPTGLITVSRNNGLPPLTSQITFPVIPPDSYVTGISVSPTGLITVSRNNGLPPLTSQITFPVIPPDSYVTGISVSPTGLITVSRNNGLPPLTSQITFPAVVQPSITDLGSSVNNDAGSISITSSDGNDTSFVIDNAAMFPSAWVRVGTTNNQGVSGDKPPNVSLSTGKANLYGGFSFDANGHLVVPKSGVYRFMYRVAAIANLQTLYTTGSRLLCKLMINGVQFSQLIEDDYSGTHSGEELNDFREHIAELNKGDTITIVTAEETAGHWLDAYDITINFISRNN